MPESERAAIWCAVSSEEEADPDLPSLDEQEAAGIAARPATSSSRPCAPRGSRALKTASTR